MPVISIATEVRVGSNLASSVYLGSNQVWPAGWNPSEITTEFWYDPSDADSITTSGSTITNVADKSGKGYDLSVITVGKTGPTIGTRKLNGLNVFEYASPNPNNQILENDIFSYDQQNNPLNIAMIFRSDSETVSTQDFLFAGSEDVFSRVTIRRTTTDSIQMLGTEAAIVTSDGIAPDDADFILVTKWNYTNSQLRLNGFLLNSGSIGTAAFASINLGASEGKTNSIEGYIAEVVAFSDNSKQEIVEGYLAWKWGLVANLPAGHPYKNNRP
jgi:hypothetical protein